MHHEPSFKFKATQIPLNPITCDLSKPLSTRLQHCVDIILFNPPYVPTAYEESFHAQGDAGIAGAWAGGLDGMEVTDRFLDNVEVCHTRPVCNELPTTGQSLLSDSGKFYLVAVTQNNIPEIRERMRKQFNMSSQVCTIFGVFASLMCSRLQYKDELEGSTYTSFAFLGAEIYYGKKHRLRQHSDQVHECMNVKADKARNLSFRQDYIAKHQCQDEYRDM